METQTAFDLNQAIQNWREDLARSGTLRTENLNELESHLRDSIERLRARELSDEEAFVIATKRLGTAGALMREFGKVNRKAIWLERLLWMLVGVLVWMLIAGIAGSLTQSLLLLSGGNLGFAQGTVWSASASTFVRSAAIVGIACLFWWFMVRQGGRWAPWIEKKLQKRSFFLVCCIAAPLLLIASNALFFVFQWYALGHAGPEIYGRSSVNLSISQIATHLLQCMVMIASILTLARKRLVTKNA